MLDSTHAMDPLGCHDALQYPLKILDRSVTRHSMDRCIATHVIKYMRLTFELSTHVHDHISRPQSASSSPSMLSCTSSLTLPPEFDHQNDQHAFHHVLMLSAQIVAALENLPDNPESPMMPKWELGLVTKIVRCHQLQRSPNLFILLV